MNRAANRCDEAKFVIAPIVCCYVCSSPDIAADADPRSPTCERCKPARGHVVSNRTGAGGSLLAVCPCGWQFEVSPRPGAYNTRDLMVRMHWRAMIHAARRA